MYRSTLLLTSLLLSTSTAVLVDYQVWIPHPIPRFCPISDPYTKSSPEQLHGRRLLLRQHQRHGRQHRQRLHLPRPAPRPHTTSHRLSPAKFRFQLRPLRRPATRRIPRPMDGQRNRELPLSATEWIPTGSGWTADLREHEPTARDAG